MLSKRDFAFLMDYTDFGYLNHFIAALALYHGGMDADQLAEETHLVLEQMVESEARRTAQDRGTGPVVQTVIHSKIYAEYVACIEDFAALLYAIRYRQEDGIFVKYMNSQRKIFTWLDEDLLKPRYIDLGTILNLPSVETLSKYLQADEISTLEAHYHGFAEDIVGTMNAYRRVIDNTSGPQKLPENWRNSLHTVIGLKREEKKNVRPMSATFNKIKHRYMVVEEIDKLIQAEPDLEYTTMPKDS